jgi:ketosteroid isomerase-like protein
VAADQATVARRLATLEGATALFNRVGGAITDGPPELDPGELELFWDPDVDWSPLTGRVVEGMSYRGFDGQRAYWRDLAEAWAEIHAEALDVAVCERGAVSVVELRGLGRGSGVEIRTITGIFWQFRGDRIISGRAYPDPDEAFVAAGITRP